jgi:SAM-dependent methyltransferase
VLADAGSTSVYELGVGDATPLITLAGDGLRVAGNDISAEMVKVARANMQAHGLDPLAIAHLDVQDEGAMAAEHERAGAFDAVMALGVIPHVADDTAFVEAMDGFLRPGGRLVLQFRNSLFSMFTFNRLTKEFILDDLLADVDPVIRDVVAADLDARLAVDKPPVRTRPTGDGYDEILSRFHNPFELAEVVREQGYSDIRYHWYNYHPAYPMIADRIDPMEYRRAQVAMEHEGTWRGMFLCSAGVIEAVKDPA